jgi:hypothetical protein
MDRYRTGTFSDLLDTFEINLEYDLDALAKISAPAPGQDLEENERLNCIAVLDACAELTPYHARDERVWAYLTHSEMLNYTREKWQIPTDEVKALNSVKSHFFASDKRSLEARNGVSRLYWLGYLARRISQQNTEEVLDLLLQKTDIRSSFVERPTTLRAEKVSVAVAYQLEKSQREGTGLEERAKFRGLMSGLNTYCGSMLIECLPNQKVYEVVTSIASEVLTEPTQSTTDNT